MTHPLDQALKLAADLYVYVPEDREWKYALDLMCITGDAGGIKTPEQRLAPMAYAICACRRWWQYTQDLLPDEVHDDGFDGLVRAEFDHIIHTGMGITPLNQSLGHEGRARLLIAAHTEVLNARMPGGDIPRALVHLAAVAAAWLARILDDTQGR